MSGDLIMIVGGYTSGRYTNNVTILDVAQNTTCQGIPYPITIKGSAGGFVSTPQGQQPVVCGGFDSGYEEQDKCNRLNSGRWEELNTLSQPKYALSGVSINSEWLFITGGWDGSNDIKETFLLNGSGRK